MTLSLLVYALNDIDFNAETHLTDEARMVRDRFTFDDSARGLVEVDVIYNLSLEEWATLPESGDRTWNVLRVDGRVSAAQLTLANASSPNRTAFPTGFSRLP